MTTPLLLEELSLIQPPEKFSEFKSLSESCKEFQSKICHPRTSNNLIDKVAKTTPDGEKVLLQYANDSYPVLHEDVLPLLQEFLKFKKNHGNKTELKVYENATVLDLVDRLIAKVRALYCCTVIPLLFTISYVYS